MRYGYAVRLSAILFFAACSNNQTTESVQIGGINRYPLGDGIELVKLRIKRGPREVGFVHAVYAEPEKIELELTLNPDRKPISAFDPNALAVSNAGFFTEAWKPTGFLKSKTNKIAPFISKGGPAGSGVFLLQKGRAIMIERDKAKPEALKHATFGIQAGPRVIENGGGPGIRSDDGKRRNRTLIGADQRGRLVIACMISDDGWDDGVSLFEIQKLLGQSGIGASGHEDLRLQFALNLDGGPSTGFHLRHGRHRVDATESTPVHSVLSLKVKH